MNKLDKASEDIEKRISEINSKTQDLNMAEILKSNAAAFEGEEGQNALAINLISKLENKLNTRIKATEDRLNKLEESNFKMVKDIQNIKNAQDLSKRNINTLKQSNENLITNIKNMEMRITKVVPKIEQKSEETEKIIKKETKDPEKTPTKEDKEKEKNDSVLNTSKTPEPQIDLDNNEKFKEIVSRISDIERAVKILPNQLGIEQIKLDISALKSGIRNFALVNDLKESKEKEEDIQKQLNFLKEQFEDYISNNADHEDIQNVKRKMELLNSKTHDLEDNFQIMNTKLNTSNKNKVNITSYDKYLETQIFDNFKAQIIKEFSSVNEFAERIETTKNFKYLDAQIKNILQIYIKKEKRSENWLLAKKPITNLCASCEAYIGELKDNNSYQPWNKYPMKDPNDKVYRLGNGFSKMLQMVQLDENDKKNTGMVTQQNNKEFNLGNKLLKLDKVDSNLNNNVNLGPIKTDNSNSNSHNTLPKIKGNNTVSNFNRKNNVNNIGENARKNKEENLTMKENENDEQIDMGDISDEDDDKKPKIMKITKIIKE